MSGHVEVDSGLIPAIPAAFGLVPESAEIGRLRFLNPHFCS